VAPLFTPLPGSPSFNLLKQEVKKYEQNDIINWNEATQDWIQHFCNVSYKEILETQKYLRQFPYDISSYSY
jgi:hypothetical protein